MKLWILIAVGSVAALALGFWITGLGSMPRYRHYRMAVELTVRGERISLAGDLRCVRRRSGINTGWHLRYGLARPATLATRLESGEVVAVKTASFCGSGIPDHAAEWTPSVFVFDGGNPPGRIDAYVDPAYLRDPASDVHVRSVSFGAMRGSSLPELWGKGDAPTRASDLVPWVNAPAYQRANGPHWFYRGYLLDSISLDDPGAAVPLSRVEPREEGLTRIDYDTEAGRETLRRMQDEASGRLGMHVDWADPGGRCWRDANDPLCRVLSRQRPLRFEVDEGRHVIGVPADTPRGPLRMLPVSGGPPPRYAGKIGYSGDEEISEKVSAALVIDDARLEMPHDFISQYALAVTIDWRNRRLFRVFLVELDPSVFDES